MGWSFQNKVALVTGAGSGMGLATARAFAAAGAAVTLADANEDAVRSAAENWSPPDTRARRPLRRDRRHPGRGHDRPDRGRVREARRRVQQRGHYDPGREWPTSHARCTTG